MKNNCDVSSSPTKNAIGVTYTPPFNLTPTGVGFAEFNNLGYEFNGVLTATATATATIVTNENKNKNIFESVQYVNIHKQKIIHHIKMHQELIEMIELVQLMLEVVNLIILDVYLKVIWMELESNMIYHLVCILFFFFCFFCFFFVLICHHHVNGLLVFY